MYKFDSILNKMCQECGGKCCQYNADIAIEKSEVEKLESLGADIDGRFDSYVMIACGRGCTFSKEGKCSIYEDRPSACRNFDCRNCGKCWFFDDFPEVKELIQRYKNHLPK